jgi:hypothetical protein
VDGLVAWPVGRDTLVVDVTAFNGESWFDRAGNYQTSNLHVVERYRPMGRDVLHYEATIEDFDPKTNFQGSRETLRLVERYAPLDANTLDYRFTVDDPKTFTRP